MKWSLRIARIAGIDVYLHWTFLILLAWVSLGILGTAGAQKGTGAMLWSLLLLFVFVLMHEFGHALMGKRFGVKTSNITLLPIGGVASMERMPEEPVQEFLIAIAGPAVNFFLAIFLALYLTLTNNLPTDWENLFRLTTNFGQNLLAVNVVLFVFNLVPAFPMDGGRMLRAMLAIRYDRTMATNIAARIGQFLAIAFVFIGLMYNFWLIFIGIFIYLGAGAEASFESTHSVLSKYTVKDVLMRQHTLLDSEASIREAVQLLLDGQEKEFLVQDEGRIIGTITRDELILGLGQHGQEGAIRSIHNPNLIYLSPDMPLEDVFMQMSQQKVDICPVVESGQLIGVLNRENIIELVMVANALKKNKKFSAGT